MASTAVRRAVQRQRRRRVVRDSALNVGGRERASARESFRLDSSEFDFGAVSYLPSRKNGEPFVRRSNQYDNDGEEKERCHGGVDPVVEDQSSGVTDRLRARRESPARQSFADQTRV